MLGAVDCNHCRAPLCECEGVFPLATPKIQYSETFDSISFEKFPHKRAGRRAPEAGTGFVSIIIASGRCRCVRLTVGRIRGHRADFRLLRRSILSAKKAMHKQRPCWISVCRAYPSLGVQRPEIVDPKFNSKTAGYENRTKSEKSGALETNEPRERNSTPSRSAAVLRLVLKARRYWRSCRA